LAGEDAYFGRDNQPKNTELAIQLWEQAAKLGSVAAAKSLAEMYSDGNETKRDLTKALHWYSVAAGLGDVPSQERIRHILLNSPAN
ncbi:tetratricopeptide repeat protein, partial [Undibacterium luofuense]|uniref:tetratricopeptide repeat protein n=1 Tax=Undibacterium luofuense TaxID=2828733 RepID=UPI003C6F8924